VPGDEIAELFVGLVRETVWKGGLEPDLVDVLNLKLAIYEVVDEIVEVPADLVEPSVLGRNDLVELGTLHTALQLGMPTSPA